MKSLQVAVVGGGIIGVSAALALAKQGARVQVYDARSLGGEASSASAGLLGVQLEFHRRAAREERGHHLPLFLEARAMFKSWVTDIERESGLDCGYRTCGALVVALNSAEQEEVAEAVAWQCGRGLEAHLVGSGEARKIESEISEQVVGAAHYPGDAQVDPRRLLPALEVCAVRAGVKLRPWTAIRSLHIESRGAGDECVGIRTDDGTEAADLVLVAGGAWTSLLAGIPEGVLKVRPVRGQMILLEQRPARLRSIVYGNSAYALPRGDGRILVGSTVEFSGYDTRVTAGGVARILGNILPLIPGLSDAAFVTAWAGLRPHADEVVFADSPIRGLLVSTGHFRHGILLAPITASKICDAVEKIA